MSDKAKRKKKQKLMTQIFGWVMIVAMLASFASMLVYYILGN